jgi:hypothetical protein
MEEALGGYIFFYTYGPFFILPLISGFLIDTEIEWTDDIRVLFLGIFFCVLFFIWTVVLLSRSLPRHPSGMVWFYRVLGAAIVAPIFAFMCIGYFTFWNAVSGSGEKVLVSGPVVHMEVGTAGRLTGKPRYITIRHNGRDIKLTVSPQEYSALSLGQTYYREMKLGGLGYYYNWGSSWWK